MNDTFFSRDISSTDILSFYAIDKFLKMLLVNFFCWIDKLSDMHLQEHTGDPRYLRLSIRGLTVCNLKTLMVKQLL